jgi:hypothetical protein
LSSCQINKPFNIFCVSFKWTILSRMLPINFPKIWISGVWLGFQISLRSYSRTNGVGRIPRLILTFHRTLYSGKPQIVNEYWHLFLMNMCLGVLKSIYCRLICSLLAGIFIYSRGVLTGTVWFLPNPFNMWCILTLCYLSNFSSKQNKLLQWKCNSIKFQVWHYLYKVYNTVPTLTKFLKFCHSRS